MNILTVQSSPNVETSFTRAASHELVQALKKKHHGATVTTRDVIAHPVPHVLPATLGAIFSPPAAHTADQKAILGSVDKLVDEVIAADVIVIGAPMYNFSVPSSLKAWIDAIVRTGRTFNYTDKGPVGLLAASKHAVFVTASGGVYSEGPSQAFDHLDPYLRAIFSFLGLKQLHSIRVEGTAFGPDAVAKAKAASSAAIAKLVAAL